MAKRRVPGTIEDALDQAVGFVGKDTVAAWVGKSVNVVGKWSDPDKAHHQVPLATALEIDRRLALAGYPQPFAELVAAAAQSHALAGRQLAHALEEHTRKRPLQEATEMVCAAARLVRDLEKAEADGVYTPAEVDKLRRELRALQKRIPAIAGGVTARRGRRP